MPARSDVARRALASALCVVALSSCNAPRAGLRDWRPEDHDSGARSGAVAAPRAATPPGADDLAAIRALFNTQCASCHGEQGHGDGPMAAMFRPADLASQPVQAKSDAELTRVIAAGRNRMPAFGDRLPPDAYPLLIRLIRSFR